VPEFPPRQDLDPQIGQMTFDLQPEQDPWWTVARQADRKTVDHSIQEGAYSKAPSEEEGHQNLATPPQALGPQKAARNQEAQDRNMGEDNILLLAVAERMALTQAQES